EAAKAFATGLDSSPKSISLEQELREAKDLLERLRTTEEKAKGPGASAANWEALARLSYLARRYPQAASAAAEALKRDKNQPRLLLLQGLALEHAGKSSDAASALKRIPREAPEFLTAQYHRAYLARLQGEDSAEERIWAEAAQMRADDSTSRLMLLLLWKRAGTLQARLETLHKKNSAAGPGGGDALLGGLALE